MQEFEDRTENILIVEDEGLIAADVQKKLQRLGYPIPAIAQSGAEAIRCARSTPPSLHHTPPEAKRTLGIPQTPLDQRYLL